NPSIHPQFRSKTVCKLFCQHCSSVLCERGMRAILLGNINIELFSTDIPPLGVQLVFSDYFTKNCACRIRDAACLGCGNVVGYHVTTPCSKCLESCNNGHFWMFLSEGVSPVERFDATG
ncbi:protein FAM72, partial [Gorgonomyces haynaldii]